MDVTYAATPMTAKAVMSVAVVAVVEKVFTLTTLVSQVAVYARPLSIGGTSLSAVAPDNSFLERNLALA